ncbi:hypothetical protein K8O68_11105 [Salipaludibacillus sp. CUR1]|uniref:hypothetical protein n=1 Tax=Salipaludibacillus sp. CUR1 TaxID=2820003 RepID=UPI001E30A03C|nr:hypothetical protein [Salipaludibacillus sp. CUR1]MCE7792964.1 hypothetical protein [Salipaludibacillus sp. CUR1]
MPPWCIENSREVLRQQGGNVLMKVVWIAVIMPIIKEAACIKQAASIYVGLTH